jgi:glycerophosphoryl diester phosphodiesterase
VTPKSGEPLVFAHRGASAALPEHTLGAYLRAIEEGADGLECDVRLTRDGHLVCLHDRRLERTSNGRGLVSTKTLAELSALDFGYRHPGPPDDTDGLIRENDGLIRENDGLIRENDSPGRASVLTLDRLLTVACAAARPIRLLIETKHPTRYGEEVERALVDTLRRFGLDRPDPDGVHVSVMSFAYSAVRRCRRLAPDLPTVLLLEFLPPWHRGGKLPTGVRIAGPGVDVLRNHPRLASRLRERGHEFYVWTVNTAEDLAMVRDLGATGIITDRPAFVLSQLGRA